jgi:regulatory protein
MAERPDAVETALRALRFRDRSTAELDLRLERRGVGAAERVEALETLERIGYVDDERFARSRAERLAERGSGDALIRDDLERRGVAAEVLEAALAGLAPERERAARIVERRGPGMSTARYLAARGFGEDVLEGIVAQGD